MRMGTRTLAACAVTCLFGSPVAAQVATMTLADVLARAREQAPQIVSARLAVEEARARLTGAGVRQTNPQLDFAVGNRSAPDQRFTDFEVGFGQPFEPDARRAARIDSANAAIVQSAANVDEVTRTVLRDAAAAYYRALHAGERIKLLNAAAELAAAVYSSADRRFRAGDIAVLDVNIARASLARVSAEREGAEAARAVALGELKRLLRLEGPVDVAGPLTNPASTDLNTALQAASLRPELRALEAGVREAEAEIQLGLSYTKPEYGMALRYSQEERDHIVLGGMTVTLPMFSKGQEQRALGTARAARLRADLEAATARVQIEVRAAFETYTRRLSALRVLETDAIPGLDENEQLTTRSFDAGQIGLVELLLIRREILETRFQYLDALLEAALARIDLAATAALLR
jgi:cobalt-zinc-cadmium efflux system outer membrane protein